MSTTSITIRMDENLKKQAEELFADMGMNMTTAFTVFAKTAVREGRIPFEIRVSSPNAETIAAMKEAEELLRDPNAKTYRNVDTLFADLMAECTK